MMLIKLRMRDSCPGCAGGAAHPVLYPGSRRPEAPVRSGQPERRSSTPPGRRAPRPGPGPGRGRAGRPAPATPVVDPVPATSSICWATRPAAVTPRLSAPPASLWETWRSVSTSPAAHAAADRGQGRGGVGHEVADGAVEVGGVAGVEVAQLVDAVQVEPVEVGRGCRTGAPLGGGRRARRVSGSQPGVEHGGQRGEVDRLGEEVVHARGQAALALALDRRRGHRDHGQPRSPAPSRARISRVAA